MAGLALLALAIAALLPVAYRIARPFASAIMLAGILAVVLDPVRERVGRRVTRPSTAALITTAVAIGPVLSFGLLAGGLIAREIKSGALSGILRAGQRLTAAAPVDTKVAQQAAGQINQVVGCLFTGALTLLFLYVFLVHGQNWVAQLTALLPLEAAATNRIISTTRDAIVANVDGIVAVGAVDAILFGIVFWIAGVGSPALWGALAGLASMTPIIGALIVWLPMAVIVSIKGSWVKGLLMALASLAVQTADGMVLRPRVIGKRLQQPSLLIALSVLGATDAFGALGILLGPVIVSVLAALVREFRLQLQPKT